jgi:hypothetical protein
VWDSALWCLLPTICSETFGRAEFSYNWGWITAASGVGSPVFNAVFGHVYDEHNVPGTNNCIGRVTPIPDLLLC